MAGGKGSPRHTARKACGNEMAGWQIWAFRGTKPQSLDSYWGSVGQPKVLGPPLRKMPGDTDLSPEPFDREMLADFIRLLYDILDLAGLEARLDHMNQSDEL